MRAARDKSGSCERIPIIDNRVEEGEGTDDGQGKGPGTGTQSKIESLQSTFNDTVDETRGLVKACWNRYFKLSTLSERAETLNASAAEFNQVGEQVRRKMWWAEFKWKLLIGAAVVLIILILMAAVVYPFVS